MALVAMEEEMKGEVVAHSELIVGWWLTHYAGAGLDLEKQKLMVEDSEVCKQIGHSQA